MKTANKRTKRNISLTQYLVEEQREKGLIPGELRLLLEVVARACKRISISVNKGALGSILGEAGTENVQGEGQKKLDVIANSELLEANEWGGHLAAMASEEMETPYPIPHRYPLGEFLLLFDPLDGSSNIDVNVSIGTIFSVLKFEEGSVNGRAKPGARAAGRAGRGAGDEPFAEPTEKSFLQPGHRQLAAGYAVYGPATVLVLTVGDGVASFTLDRETASWSLTEERMVIPEKTKEYAINASNARHWYPPITRYVDELLAGKQGPRRKDFNMRWVGSMVADVHRILTRGGIFLYPADSREPDKPGKLRLLYEANPMSMLVEQAGGAATDGRQRILDIVPDRLHQRVPVILGSKEEVERVTSYHDE